MNTRNQVAAAYDHIAPWYDSWEWQKFWDRNEAPIIRSEIARVGCRDRAIDLGVGTGRYLSTLRLAGFESLGLDISSEMIAIAAKKLASTDGLIVGDLMSDAPALGTFELAIAARVFCHLDDLKGAFCAASSIVAPGGVLIVTELDFDHEFERTKVPTPNGKIEIDTWKRTSRNLISAAESVGWHIDNFLQVNSSNCAWVPDEQKLRSIDRSSRRAIFNVFSFRRA